MVWTLVEPGLAITAASLITLRPLLRAWNLKGFHSSNSHATDYAHSHPTALSNNHSYNHRLENWNVLSKGRETDTEDTKEVAGRIKGFLGRKGSVGGNGKGGIVGRKGVEVVVSETASDEFILGADEQNVGFGEGVGDGVGGFGEAKGLGGIQRSRTVTIITAGDHRDSRI